MDTNRLYELAEKADKLLQMEADENNKKELEVIIKELAPIIKEIKQGSIGMAQIDPIVGDIEYNALKVMKYISFAQKIGLDAVVFPELILMGYPIEDTIDRHPIIVEENIKWLKEIAKLTTSITAIVGFVEPRKYRQKIL